MLKPLEPGVPPADYRKLGAAVDLTCTRCIHRRILSLKAVIERLQLHGLGGERTGIRAVAVGI